MYIDITWKTALPALIGLFATAIVAMNGASVGRGVGTGITRSAPASSVCISSTRSLVPLFSPGDAGHTPCSGHQARKRTEERIMTVIAMTREIGSYGLDVAAGLAVTLGLKIIQSDIVANSIAERLGADEGAVLRYVNGSASLLERWQIDRRKLFHYAAEQILRLAQQGNVLIKGWGVATLLCDVPGVISVRVCAPLDFRVRVLMDRLGTKDANAVREQIERYDAARTRTMRAYFDVEQEDPHLYHIVLNTERLSIEACVKIIRELVESDRYRDNATNQSTLVNKLVEAEISSALAEQIGYSAAPLGVSVSVADGEVTLAGMTSSGSVRMSAERIAHDIAGVCHINNRIVSVPTRGVAF
jgi:cytidylate kinase